MFKETTSIIVTYSPERGKKYIKSFFTSLGLVSILQSCDLALENTALHLQPQEKYFQEP